VASLRIKWFFSSVKLGPTHHSRRALTSAESWPRSASSGFPSVKSGPTHRSRRALTSAESWPRSASSGFLLRSRQ
jgi:hypothetical protein